MILCGFLDMLIVIYLSPLLSQSPPQVVCILLSLLPPSSVLHCAVVLWGWLAGLTALFWQHWAKECDWAA